jgi:hypothetical protein
MTTPYERALATAKLLSDELKLQTERRQAMELCVRKMQDYLVMYKGRCVDRICFHLNRHHTEYLRKVRVTTTETLPHQGRATVAEIRRLEQVVRDRDAEIGRLRALLGLNTPTPSKEAPNPRSPY